jgi:hypothetical protein
VTSFLPSLPQLGKVARFFWVQEPVMPPAWHSQWTLGLSYSRTLYMTSASRAPTFHNLNT